MEGTIDCREDVLNNLISWAASHGIDPSEAKYDFYMMLNNVEITSRCTEIAQIEENRNEYLLKKFLIAKKVKGCTDRTLQFYGTSIKSILQRIGKTVDDITADDIRFYMAVRIRQDKVSKTTVGNETRNLGSFFTWLYLEEEIKRNPMSKVDRIKKEKVKKEALTELEIEQLRASAEGEREKMIVEVLLSTGCRVSELVQILISEIDGDKILVHGKGKKDRYVYLNARAKFSMQRYLECRKDSNPYLLPRSVSIKNMEGRERAKLKEWWKNPQNVSEGHSDKGTIECMMRKMAERAGVDKANPHKFRRTCATMALRRGMPIEQVSKMLGHESLETTQIYLDLEENELEQAHKKYVV